MGQPTVSASAENTSSHNPHIAFQPKPFSRLSGMGIALFFMMIKSFLTLPLSSVFQVTGQFNEK